jgi:hypothetical protein
LTRLRPEDGAVVKDVITYDESCDPLVGEAAFELVEVLSRHGVTAGEIRITFGSEAPEGASVKIELPALTDSITAQPDFPGLQGVLALFTVTAGSRD